MENITIGGVYHDKVFGGEVPGPIWRDAMTGALEGKDAPPFNLVPIPDPPKRRQGPRQATTATTGDDDGDNGRHDDGGDDGGTTFPTPTFSIPDGLRSSGDEQRRRTATGTAAARPRRGPVRPSGRRA